MRAVILDARVLDHITAAQAFGFPSYYGRNLDALYDCLGDIFEETAIVVLHAGEAGEDSARILRVIRDCAQDNRKLRLFYAEEQEEETSGSGKTGSDQ